MKSYEELLDQAKENLPEDIVEASRFNIPKVRGHIEGNKTIISNFNEIADTLGRKQKHLLKYVLKEVGAPGEVVKNRVIIGTKIAASRVNEAIKGYAEDFVFCRECGKPESKLSKEGSVTILKCQACGAQYPVYGKI
jgi:translation initiation factor 2 subunit 2